MATQIENETDIDKMIDALLNHKLIVYNDDHNTFDHVIDCLMKYCQHTYHQASQCATIIHYKGKYAVKEGDFVVLTEMKRAICEKGLKATVE